MITSFLRCLDWNKILALVAYSSNVFTLKLQNGIVDRPATSDTKVRQFESACRAIVFIIIIIDFTDNNKHFWYLPHWNLTSTLLKTSKSSSATLGTQLSEQYCSANYKAWENICKVTKTYLQNILGCKNSDIDKQTGSPRLQNIFIIILNIFSKKYDM